MELQQGRGIFAPSARVSHNDARDFVQAHESRGFRHSARRERPSPQRESGNSPRSRSVRWLRILVDLTAKGGRPAMKCERQGYL